MGRFDHSCQAIAWHPLIRFGKVAFTAGLHGLPRYSASERLFALCVVRAFQPSEGLLAVSLVTWFDWVTPALKVLSRTEKMEWCLPSI